MYELIEKPEQAIAIAVVKKGADKQEVFDHLDELEDLANTAGAEIIEKIYQELDKPNPATAIGKGKLEEVKLSIMESNISLVIFDDDLTPAQVRNLESELQIKVIDRSGLILDIFAKHARTLEAKTQVGLAQAQYLLPRLTRMWTHLSKQFGGIGTKGPGETQIETDRRILRERIQKLKADLEDIKMQKIQQRKNRSSLPRISLVGYTNAGKSTLMNTITESEVYVEDKLFATLDTTVRAFDLSNGKKALMSDTVGFIRKLPHHLVASFRSTLSEAAEADILLHVVDVSHPFFREHIQVVGDTIESLKIGDKPTIIVFNKVDKLEDLELLKILQTEYPSSIPLSAKRGINISQLLDAIIAKLEENTNVLNLFVPYSQAHLTSKLYELSEIIEKEETDEGIRYTIRMEKNKKDILLHHFAKFVIE